MHNQTPVADGFSVFLAWLIGIIVVLLFLFLCSSAKAQFPDEFGVSRTPNPMDWISKYKGRRMGCCGHQDCIQVRMRIIEGSAREIGGQPVFDVEFFKLGETASTLIREFPARAVHVSEDEKDYFCFVPTVFGDESGRMDIYNDPCVKNPQLECSNCFFFSPKA